MANDRPRILRAIKKEGRHIRDPHAREAYERAAVQTGLVETNLTNPSGGDADSAGWRQERRSLYADPTNIEAAARRFRQEFEQHYSPGEKSYDVAAQVQRPAAQYRGRYKERAGEAAALLKSFGGGGATAPIAGSPARTSTRTVGGVDNSAQRGALIASFLGDKSSDPLTFAMGIRGLQDTPGRTVTTTTGSQPGSSAGTSSSKLVSRANAIDAKKLPYQWGGGHGEKVDAYNAQPLDCSGAVSAVLGINPRVASQFEAWGKPGEGGAVTIYANGHHVLMKIGGHFFGTSRTNPGGGAGWIPQGAISPEYLKGFTARHS